ncbi:glycoside hydrolase family 97 N-terminal domain-containing protein [Flavobacterium sp. FlaQc-57]|uniref:glycoside hydrolase family 97 N-terminal domain-containing protein n=1 Tax=Flavobacterium sp. FlaQc-57 TaxID=3374186 RepID=UPI003756D53B
MNFKGNYSVEFRAFDEGIAYRFITAKKEEIEVINEDFSVNFPTDYFHGVILLSLKTIKSLLKTR